MGASVYVSSSKKKWGTYVLILATNIANYLIAIGGIHFASRTP
jgi:hypothetical protein